METVVDDKQNVRLICALAGTNHMKLFEFGRIGTQFENKRQDWLPKRQSISQFCPAIDRLNGSGGQDIDKALTGFDIFEDSRPPIRTWDQPLVYPGIMPGTISQCAPQFLHPDLIFVRVTN